MTELGRDRDGEELEAAQTLRVSLFIDTPLGRRELYVGIISSGWGFSAVRATELLPRSAASRARSSAAGWPDCPP
ncbi:hypothetical protein ASF22_19520 [Methylobacterium sp. Leaf87]|nr:hypothetical protein ASF22_19520 [Methylobacterium sp. Leaf87]